MFQSIPSYYRYVSSITITNGGSSYTSVPTLTISGGGGTGATATATIKNGIIDSVKVTNIGSNYDTSPTVTVSGGGGSGAILSPVLSFASGTSVEYQEKSSLTASNPVPSFVAEEYATFITFLDKYYEYMDQDGKPTNKLLNTNYFDIDDANTDVLDKWALQLAANFPRILKIDRNILYKNIKNIYEAKGSERSIKAFFRIAYGEEVEVYYPSKDILKASDGVWVEENSVRAISGYNNYEVLDLEGRQCDIKYYSSTGSATIEKTIPATITVVEKIAYTSPQRYELALVFDNKVTNIPGPGSQATATANVVGGEITSFTITNGGYDYTAAPTLIIVDSGTGTGAEAKATVTDGAVTAITITDGGSDYTEATTSIEFNTNAVRTSVVDRGAVNSPVNVRAYLERTLSAVTSASFSGANAGFKVGNVFAINETGDDGKSYALSYFAEDYTYFGGGNKAYIKVSSVDSKNVPNKWSIINSGSGFLNANSTITITSPTGEDLDINLTTNYLFSYDGKYVNDRGKLSDVNRLQDNFKYQNYSYIVKSSLSSSVWIKNFKQVTHTAGMEVFGDIVISNVIDYAPDISYQIDGGLEIFIHKLTDTTLATEVHAINLSIVLSSETATATESSAKHVDKTLSDNTIESGIDAEIGVSDSGGATYFAEDYCDPSYSGEGGFFIEYNKAITEAISSIDVFSPTVSYVRTHSDTATVSENFTKSVGYGRSFTEQTSSSDVFSFLKTTLLDFTESVHIDGTTGINIDISKEFISDNATHTSSASINIAKVLAEAQTASESAAFSLQTPFTDTGTLSDSGVITIQDYVDPTYFGADYVGDGYSF